MRLLECFEVRGRLKGIRCRAAKCVASCAEHMLLLPLGVQDSNNVQIVTELCAGGDLQKYVEVCLRSRVASDVGAVLAGSHR